MFTTQLKDSVLTQEFYHLTIELLSAKMCTFHMVTSFLCGNHKVTTWD